MNWSMAGQVLTVWGMAAFLAGPLIGRYLRKRRVRNEMLAVVRAEADRRRDRLEANLPRRERGTGSKTHVQGSSYTDHRHEMATEC